MPQVALAAASFTTTAATTAAAATAAKAAMVATLKSVAISVVKNLAIAAAMSALQPQVGAAGRTFEWTLDPDGPIPFAAGRVGVAGSAVHRKTFGPDLMYYGFVSIISGAGPIDGYETFRGDDEFVTFDAAGKAVTSQWTGEMWMRRSLGYQPDTALSSPSGLKHNATLPMWSGSHRLSGKAAYMLVLGENSKRSAYPTGEPKPLHVVRGLKGWDPRRDDTYPGGSGPCRLHDPSTWIYITNPILWGLKWALGLWESPVGKGAPQVGYQVGGIGAKLSGKGQVLDSFLQAGGAIYAQRAGKISCISRAAPRASLVTITAFDTAGPLEIDTAASRIDRINTIRPKFWSEAHRWQLTAIDDVTAQAYQDEDGGVRPRPLDYHYVPSAKQAAQLAALQIAHTREGIAGVIPLKPHMQRIRPGDAFTITESGFVLNGLKCLCLNTEYDPGTRIVRVTFVSETDGKYAWALGQSPTPPAPPALTPVDPTHVSPPQPGDWTIIPRPPAPGGGQLPGFDLGGVVSNATATAVIVEHGPTATGPWAQAYQGPPTVTNIPIDGLQPGATYYIAVQYQRDQNYSERYIYGPYVAPDLIAGGLAPESPIWGQLNDLTKQALRTAIEAAQALLDEEQRRQIEVEDILDRLGLGFLLDPVTRTALIKSETVVQGVGPGGLPETLVQMSARLVAADAANTANTAQALITAEAKINALRSESYAAFATYNAMGDAIAANALVIRGQVTAEIVTATANLVSSTQMGTAISNSEVSLRNWTNGRISESVTGLASTAYVAGSLATAKGQWEAYADDAAARSIVGLDSVAAREAALGAAVLSLQSWSDGRFASGAALLAVQSTANNASSTAALALSAAHGNEAYAALTVDAGDRLTAMRINGVTRAIDFLAETFNVTAEGGNGISYSAASKIFKIFGDGQKTLMKASGDVRFWSGPSSVPDGWETAENGVIALGPGVPGGGRFNGLTLSRPFDTGVGSDAAIVIQPDTWTVIAETSLHYMRDGVFMTAASIEALVSSSTADGSVSWVVESVNAAGGDPVIVAQGGFLLPANIIPWTTGRSAYLPGLGRRTGERRLRLSIAWSNPPVTGVTIRKARLWGLYAAELTSWPN